MIGIEAGLEMWRMPSCCDNSQLGADASYIYIFSHGLGGGNCLRITRTQRLYGRNSTADEKLWYKCGDNNVEIGN